MSYPVQWLDQTFRTQARAEELLRPDLESGLITPHDFQLATQFLPAPHRYWPSMFAVGGSAGAAIYARFVRKPPAPLNRVALLATMGGFFGASWGQFRRAEAHATFQRLLDDPVAFSQALENVNRRTGGTRPLGWTLQRARDIAQREGMHGNAAVPTEDGWAPEAVAGDHPTSVPAPASRPAPASAIAAPEANRPRSRWDEIRAANARGGAQPSTWDVLRQGHERDRMSRSQGGQSDDGSSKLDEQAQFDALLEAERRMAGRES